VTTCSQNKYATNCATSRLSVHTSGAVRCRSHSTRLSKVERLLLRSVGNYRSGPPASLPLCSFGSKQPGVLSCPVRTDLASPLIYQVLLRLMSRFRSSLILSCIGHPHLDAWPEQAKGDKSLIWPEWKWKGKRITRKR
jgi:hypothetical protein